MICRNCKKTIPEGRNFCPFCGTKIVYSQNPKVGMNNSVNVGNSGRNQKPKIDSKYVAIISVLATLLCCTVLFIIYQNTNKQALANTANNTQEAAAVPDPEPAVQEQESNNGQKAEETPVTEKKFKTENGNTENNNASNIDVNSIETPRNYFVYNGHSYGIYDADDYGIASYEGVKKFCRDQSGYLAVINDIHENDELFDFVSSNSRVTAFFGYSDEKNENDWKWAEGYSSFTNWTYNDREKQPDNGSGYGGDEDYAEFNYERGTNSANDGTWNDAPFMDNTSLFICEWDSDLGLY